MLSRMTKGLVDSNKTAVEQGQDKLANAIAEAVRLELARLALNKFLLVHAAFSDEDDDAHEGLLVDRLTCSKECERERERYRLPTKLKSDVDGCLVARGKNTIGPNTTIDSAEHDLSQVVSGSMPLEVRW